MLFFLFLGGRKAKSQSCCVSRLSVSFLWSRLRRRGESRLRARNNLPLPRLSHGEKESKGGGRALRFELAPLDPFFSLVIPSFFSPNNEGGERGKKKMTDASLFPSILFLLKTKTKKEEEKRTRQLSPT